MARFEKEELETLLSDEIDEMREQATSQFSDTEMIWRSTLSSICNKIIAGAASPVEIKIIDDRAVAFGVPTSVYLTIVTDHYEKIIILMNEIDMTKERILAEYDRLMLISTLTDEEFNTQLDAFGETAKAGLLQYFA
jgi:hypothetical protein